MRFCFVSTMDGAPWGGSEELWSEAALGLRQAGHQVSAAVVWWPRPSSRLRALEDAGIEVTFRKPPRDLATKVRDELRRRGWISDDRASWLRRQRPDLVVISQGCNWDGLEWMEQCHAQRLPFVTKVSNNSESWWPDDQLAERMLAAYRAAHRVFCVSERNRRLLEAQIGGHLANAGICWSRYTVPHANPVPWPADDGTWRIACVARLDPAAKGQDLLIEALAYPDWKDRPLEVDFYGSGPNVRTLTRQLAELRLPNVHLRGHVNDVRAIWDTHHLLVLPSRYEGLPLSLIEAMLCARPAVATEAAGGGYLCLEDRTGFVIPSTSVAAMHETLERAWHQRHRWKELGWSAYTLAEQTVSPDPVGDFCQALLAEASRAS